MKTRIIGCGNLQRMDDGAGVLVAKRLRELGVPADIQSGGAFELLATWEHEQHVILIDAFLTGAPPGTVHLWEGDPPRLPHSEHFSSHGFGLAEAFRLGRILNCLPERLTLYGIEGARFGLGEQVSPEIGVAVERLAGQIASECLPQFEEHESLQFAG